MREHHFRNASSPHQKWFGGITAAAARDVVTDAILHHRINKTASGDDALCSWEAAFSNFRKRTAFRRIALCKITPGPRRAHGCAIGNFRIFLSHSSLDAVLVLGLYKTLTGRFTEFT